MNTTEEFQSLILNISKHFKECSSFDGDFIKKIISQENFLINLENILDNYNSYNVDVLVSVLHLYSIFLSNEYHCIDNESDIYTKIFDIIITNSNDIKYYCLRICLPYIFTNTRSDNKQFDVKTVVEALHCLRNSGEFDHVRYMLFCFEKYDGFLDYKFIDINELIAFGSSIIANSDNCNWSLKIMSIRMLYSLCNKGVDICFKVLKSNFFEMCFGCIKSINRSHEFFLDFVLKIIHRSVCYNDSEINQLLMSSNVCYFFAVEFDIFSRDFEDSKVYFLEFVLQLLILDIREVISFIDKYHLLPQLQKNVREGMFRLQIQSFSILILYIYRNANIDDTFAEISIKDFSLIEHVELVVLKHFLELVINISTELLDNTNIIPVLESLDVADEQINILIQKAIDRLL